MRSFLLAALFSLFASQVLALNITLGAVTDISASQFLAPADASLAQCATECNDATAKVTACGSDDGCLCNNATVPAIVKCEQCMFAQLIHDNRRPTDPLAGQTSALAAYSAACTLANHTIDILTNPIALSLPADWDGPFGQGLTTLGTVATVVAAVVIGTGAITVVNTM